MSDDSTDPPRWRDEGPAELRDMLRAARGGPPSLPDRVKVATAATLLTASATAAGSSGVAVKLIIAAALTVGAGTGVGWVLPRLGREPARVTRQTSRAVPPAAPSASLAVPPAVPPAVLPAVPAPIAPPPVAEPSPSAAPARERARSVGTSEAALLEVARQRLRAGDARGAASALRDFDRRFATATLREERDYLGWRVASHGASPEAAARATRAYLRAHPRGIYSARVRGGAP